MSTDKSNNPPNTDNPLLDEIISRICSDTENCSPTKLCRFCVEDKAKLQALILKERKAEQENTDMWQDGGIRVKSKDEFDNPVWISQDNRIAELDHQIKNYLRR